MPEARTTRGVETAQGRGCNFCDRVLDFARLSSELPEKHMYVVRLLFCVLRVSSARGINSAGSIYVCCLSSVRQVMVKPPVCDTFFEMFKRNDEPSLAASLCMN